MSLISFRTAHISYLGAGIDSERAVVVVSLRLNERFVVMGKIPFKLSNVKYMNFGSAAFLFSLCCVERRVE